MYFNFIFAIEAGIGKAPSMGNPHPQPCFYLTGDGDDFGGGDGDGKTFPDLTTSHCNPYCPAVGTFYLKLLKY